MGQRRRTWLAVAVTATAVLASSCQRVDLISATPSGAAANGNSGPILEIRSGGGLALSATGRFVAFESTATDILPGGNTGGVFVRDQATGTTERISGGRHPSLSADGRYVAYADQSYAIGDVRVYDRQSRTTTLVSVGGSGWPNVNPEISGDGRFVTWESAADTIVAGFRGRNVFVRDLVNGTTEVASVAADGLQADDETGTPDISADGRFVTFSSWATDLVPGSPATGWREVFVRDRLLGTTRKASIDGAGVPLDLPNLGPRISADGTVVVWDNQGTAWLRDLAAGRTEVASTGADGVAAPGATGDVSADGRIVVFTSSAALVPDDRNGRVDAFVRDRALATTTLLSSTASGQQWSFDASPATVSDDGHEAAFATEAPLAASDGNDLSDIYVRPARSPSVAAVDPAQLAPGTTTVVTVTGDGFLPGAGVSANWGGPGGATVTEVDVVSPTRIDVTVAVEPDAPPGSRSLAVWNPGFGSADGPVAYGFCVYCLTIT